MNSKESIRLAIILSGGSLLLVISLTVVLYLNFVQAQSSDPFTFPVNSSPYGISYKNWTAKWAAWQNTIPKSYNWNFKDTPGVNYVPKDCSFMQDPSSPVFFLPWVGKELGTYATVMCIVPHNKAILISVDSGTADYSDPSVKLKTPSELIRIETEGNKYPNNFQATLDGHPLDLINDEAHKVTTGLYNLTLPKDNLWDEPEGPDKGITQGWWIMLKPLSTGEHIVHYNTGYGNSKSDPANIPPGQGSPKGYIQDVTYHLVVK
ncbi:MAG: hypothetical protein ACTHKC_08245 [Candidatus Nitrosocosmicus sp.]